jgi:membrane fusion protein (multidrug efflux system)
VLFRLDDQPLKIAVAESAAKLVSARYQLAAMKSSYRQQQASLRSAQDTLAYQQREFERQKTLVKSGISSQAQFDQTQHAVDAARQQVAGAQQQFDAVLAMLGGNPAIDPDSHPQVQQAKADLEHAQLNLSYAVITAPSDGVVAKVEQLQVGNFIPAATPVFALMSSQDQWIEANFKEDQLTHMRVGQTAIVDIDAFQQKGLEARVVSLSPATGSQFSMLPPENATGNWVKVVQRLPVRLELVDPKLRGQLHSGLSATVEVDTRFHRHLFGADEAQAAPQ